MNDAHAVPSRRRALELATPFGAAIVAMVAWTASAPVVFVATLVAAVLHQVVVVVRRRSERAFGVHVVGAVLLVSLLAAMLGGPRSGVLLMPAGFAYLFVGLGLSQTSSARDRAARALRGRRIAPDEPKTGWSRDRAALSLVIPACAVAMLLVPVATWSWKDVMARFDDTASSRDVPDPARSPPPFWDDRTHVATPPRRVTGPGDAPRVGSFEFGTPDAESEQRVVCEVTPTSAGDSTGFLGALYLRGMPLVDIDGVWCEDFTYAWRVTDPDDGRTDGWCELAPRPAAADLMDLAVHQEALQLASSGESLLLSPPGTTSVEAPAVRAVPGGGLLAQLGRGTGTHDYRLIARLPSRVPFPGPGTRFATGDPRALAAPAIHRGWDKLVLAAREAAATSQTDVGRVRAVMDRLGRDFAYEQVPGSGDDADALLAFVLEGRGTCLQFAQAGALMLRSLGVPARVGRGFLAGEWDAESERYIVRARDGHAWVEVAFTGCGWVVFDPTPDAPEEKGPPRPEPEATEVAATRDDGTGEFGAGDDTTTPAGGWTSLDRFVADLRAALGGVWDWICENPWLSLAAAVIAAALTARTLGRRTRRLAGERVDVPWTRGPWEHLVADLARRGHSRRSSQTATAFAASVAKAGGDAYSPLVELTARRQAARFGGGPHTPQDDADIEAFRASLRG